MAVVVFPPEVSRLGFSPPFQQALMVGVLSGVGLVGDPPPVIQTCSGTLNSFGWYTPSKFVCVWPLNSWKVSEW